MPRAIPSRLATRLFVAAAWPFALSSILDSQEPRGTIPERAPFFGRVVREYDFARQRPFNPQSSAACASEYASELFVLQLTEYQTYCARWSDPSDTVISPGADSVSAVRYEARVVFLSDRGPAGGILFQRDARTGGGAMLALTPGGSLVLLEQARDSVAPVQVRRWDHVSGVHRGERMANDLAVETYGRDARVFVNGRWIGGATLTHGMPGAAGPVAFGLDDAERRIGFAFFRVLAASR